MPFKGTGKEYIGDDIPEVQAAVKRAIERCCLQLKAKIARQRALAEEKEKRKNLTKYIPDVSRALFGMLEALSKEEEDGGDDVAAGGGGGGAGGGAAAAGGAAKRVREADHEDLVGQVHPPTLSL